MSNVISLREKMMLIGNCWHRTRKCRITWVCVTSVGSSGSVLLSLSAYIIIKVTLFLICPFVFSQNCRGWKGLLEIIKSNSLLKQVHYSRSHRWVLSIWVQMGPEYIQRKRLPSLSGQLDFILLQAVLLPLYSYFFSLLGISVTPYSRVFAPTFSH